MEKNQMNYEGTESANYPAVMMSEQQSENKLALVSVIFSGLTLVVAIAILIITLMGQMSRPNIMRMGNGEMLPNGERPNIEMREKLPEQ